MLKTSLLAVELPQRTYFITLRILRLYDCFFVECLALNVVFHFKKKKKQQLKILKKKEKKKKKRIRKLLIPGIHF